MKQLSKNSLLGSIILITIILFLLISREEKPKDRQQIISSLAYPITIEEVVKKIGLPDSISYEDHDSGSLGIRRRKIYHYGSNQLIFSPHNVYKGKK